MSHIVTIQTQVRDPDALAAACRRLSLAEPKQETVPLFSGQATGLAVRLPNWQYPLVVDIAAAERNHPPPIGSTITFRYQELTDGGVPRFPSYVGLPAEALVFTSPSQAKGTTTMPSTASKRRFEFVGGGSDKFWEIEVAGKEVTVCFGRRGSKGQTSGKTFPDEAAAKTHADQLIAEKTGKGYVEVR